MMLRRFPANPWEGLDIPSALLLGIQRDSGPPVLLGSRRFERLRIVVIDRDEPEDEMDGDEANFGISGIVAAEREDEPEILPQLARLGLSTTPARPVRGEILRGENGALYERFGQRIRPLRSLASGPRGEVVEISALPANRPAEAPRPERAAAPDPVAPGKNWGSASVAPEDVAPPPPPPAPVAPPPPAPRETVTALRALFAAPGHWRVVRFGDFRNCLTPQLEHPERLRDTHRLPCHVQMFDAPPGFARESVAVQVLGDASRANEILAVTPPLVHALQLATVMPPPIRGAQRFAHVCPAHDPTGEIEDSSAVASEAHPIAPVSQPPPAAHVSPAPVTAVPVVQVAAAPVAPAVVPVAQSVATAPVPMPAAAVGAAAMAPTRKIEIPALYLQTAPFVISREAAHHELFEDDRAQASRLRRWLGGAARVEDGALRNWQLQLSGRPADEQLWAVPPPPGWRRDVGILGWAAQALERGGYDPALLTEWRLYWRRRGC